MKTPNHPTRRNFGIGTAVTALAVAAGMSSLPGAAAETQSVTVDDWKRLMALVAEGRKLGINMPAISSPASGVVDFNQIVHALVDFLDAIDAEETKLNGGKPEGPRSASGADQDDDEKAKGGPAAQLEDLEKRTAKLLNEINARERQPRFRDGGLRQPGATGWALFSQPAFAESLQARYEKYRDGYIKLFDTCVVTPSRQDSVNWYVDKMTSQAYRSAYEKLEEVVCVPWYFIGCIHALETSFNFRAHLHNGDPLDHKTVHVPKGRPDPWLPPSDWQSSAEDALAYEDFTKHEDWNLAKLLFRLEAYNGFRSREEHGINSPYLWSFSNHYSKGKFIADNVWSSTAVSQQCGAAVILKEMVMRKIVVPVA